MRLLDLVAQAPVLEDVGDPGGRVWRAPGAGSCAAEIQGCGLRYILDRSASRQCADVFMGTGEAPDLDLDDALLRLPAQTFWMELFSDGEEVELDRVATGRRIGYLVDADDGGRSGSIVSFAEDAFGKGRLLPGRVEFDLDGERRPASAASGTHALRHRDLPKVNEVLERTRLSMEPSWVDFVRTGPAPYKDAVAKQAELAWCALPLILGFSALLNSRFALAQRPSDLSRLNASRARRGAPALLDHVEVTLDLSARRQAEARYSAVADRNTPRMHFVRGHPVRRGGKEFWRSSHYRGAGASPLVRTVAVTSRRWAGAPEAERPGA